MHACGLYVHSFQLYIYESSKNGTTEFTLMPCLSTYKLMKYSNGRKIFEENIFGIKSPVPTLIQLVILVAMGYIFFHSQLNFVLYDHCIEHKV